MAPARIVSDYDRPAVEVYMGLLIHGLKTTASGLDFLGYRCQIDNASHHLT